MIEKLVSIVVPIYNGSIYIPSLLIDLKKQQYKAFEVIFIDDGSKDDTYQTLLLEKEKYKDDFNITIIHQENAGVSAARNVGIREAKGKYLCFVDVDDGLSPNYLNYMVKAINDTSASLVFCKWSRNYISKEEVYEVKTVSNSEEMLYRFLYHDLSSGIWSLLVRKEVLIKNNLLFEEGVKYSEDVHMLWRLITCSDIITELNNRLYIYKENQGSAMGKFSKDRLKGISLIGNLNVFFSEKVPVFYPSFKQFAEARIAWSVLWQAAHFLSYEEFGKFIESYNYLESCKMLYKYPQKYVAFSSAAFVVNPKLFYFAAKMASISHRNS